ncbi:hypothetical protein E5Z43_13530 [Vibrio cholerae]|nr:hypothetical protein [Vibrio cholerae]EGR0619248.1 hypothetical protein [Vibrio cholerae]EGR4320489.1 hypothetical protein [Vibrio cholerae]EJB8581656.1 hypothetical protein [Vibrio cholerae]EJL6430309.1 hypothetical protein [Vibrio cholerae]
MQFMMRLAPITFPIAMLAGLGWCIGIALLEQPHGIGYTLTRHCLMVFVVLAPWLMLKLMFYVIVSLGRKLGLIPPARPTHSLGYEESLYWFRVLAFFDGKRSRMPKRPIRRN